MPPFTRGTSSLLGVVQALIVFTSLTACGNTTASTRFEGEPPPTSPWPSDIEWVQTFGDEFDGRRGRAPDRSVWVPDVGGTGWGNDELQYYTDGDNTFLDGRGNLVIEARTGSEGHKCWYGRCRYTSGKLTTRRSDDEIAFAQQYGRFEARMKLPTGTGLWPAFWLLGENIDAVGHPEAGEIDVVEVIGRRDDEVEQHAHGPGLHFGAEHILPPGQSVSDWHTYGVEWTPDEVSWEVDGSTTRTLTREEAGSGWVFDQPFFILLNLAVGGEWPGSPDSSTEFPARMFIDYIRVYGPESAP
ncbi:glycoside hydrolase family 16 protein [Rhodococcus chondri]|uniref:Glycoside hydrolase family 16 protein n=1 Tax=Rhodococcus chondri TaxID=3065941 RepID=A0ABU7JNM0_9NOCA|nr:glycoside hydrolase family 16 protein [Rhodococcus sp. CC-R104]MEE2031637.1 glycoside hydrolase family 16 protein [Rhodococcus sp. CC-R104]